MSFKQAISWAEAHPVPTGVGVVAGGLVLLYVLGAFRGGSSSGASGGDSSATSAYYAAESAQAQAGDAVQIAQIQAQAGTTQTQLNDATTVTTNQTWANADLAQTQSNNQVATANAPYAVESELITGLTGIVSSSPPITTTTTSKSNGFFGIGGSNSSSTSTTTSPNATAALNELEGLVNGFQSGNG